MRRTATLVALAGAAILCTPTQAQLLNVHEYTDGPVINGTTITVYGQPTDAVISRQLPVVLNGGTPTEVAVKRYELNAPAGTENYFCWYDCWEAQPAGTHPLWYSMSPYELDPGVQFNGFYADHKPEGISGMASFLFVWYAITDTTDSVWVNIDFDVYEGAGMMERAGEVDRFDVYPNPSIDGNLFLEFELAERSGREVVVFRDATGREALRRPTGAAEQRMSIGTGLPAGLWSASLERDGRTLATRRVSIAGR